ncbi:MAG: TIGR04255 family protein [Candidatus Kapabacteria bacterium]|nr:TIGR04255 family protein [Candidatus Kapabacteria bacterium]MDW8012020.1 TIGR04255 family protein [Bacteroidota bacterium]
MEDQDSYPRYIPRYRLQNPDDPIAYQLGNRSLFVDCLDPSIGWSKFRERILHVQRLLAEEGLLPGPSHHGLRYLYLFQREDLPDASGLRLRIQLGDRVSGNQLPELEIVLTYRGYRHSLEITPSTSVTEGGEKRSGTAVSIQTNHPVLGDWSQIPRHLEDLYEASRAVLFELVLSEALIERLEPEY